MDFVYGLSPFGGVDYSGKTDRQMLRLWQDLSSSVATLAKIPNLPVPGLDHYRARLQAAVTKTG